MPMTKAAVPRWRERLQEIPTEVDRIVLPDEGGDITQDREWCEVVIAGRKRRIRFHDYHQLYEVPGLYEGLFYKHLKCCSPSRTVGLLAEVLQDDVLNDTGLQFGDLSVLDLGAGNGMVGDELQARHVPQIVGIDIISAAKMAALRDRPGVYDDYLVQDMTDLHEDVETKLRSYRFNCLTTVAALGFGDIPPRAFVQALELIETPGWIAMTIKEDFLRDCDRSGFSQLIHQLSDEAIIQIEAYRRFRHRVSITGEPLYYLAMVARKMCDVPGELLL